MKSVFSDKRRRDHKTQEQLIAELYQTIGKRDMELAWLKKRLSHLSPQDRRTLVDRSDISLPLTQQASLLAIPRSTLYYTPVVDQNDIRIINAIDEIYTHYPFYGARRIYYELSTTHGISACRDHISRLMRVMGIEAIYPKPRKALFLSQPSKEHVIYPYLLHHLIITRPNQV
ncbi:transposase [Candidatus Uhrbacteria bacterium]|nr:transposase [Candidatus Uhrbacteria bacterium]